MKKHAKKAISLIFLTLALSLVVLGDGETHTGGSSIQKNDNAVSVLDATLTPQQKIWLELALKQLIRVSLW